MARGALSRRGFVALGGAGLAASCGFSPVYAPGGAGAGLRGRVLADPPNSREAFAFVAQLEDRLGRPEAGDLRLTYVLGLREDSLALSGTGSNLRLVIVGSAAFEVLNGAGALLTQGRVESSASFTDRGTSVAVRTARADARERAAIILADRVADRLLATASGWLP